MSEMIERVARAMCQEAEEEVTRQNGEPGWQTLGYASQEAWVEENWPNYAGQARVAIEAMGEPTPEMEQAGAETMGETEGFGPPQQSGLIYRGMIHAALAPSKVPETAPQ